MELPPATVLPEDALLLVLRGLPPADILRAALVCHHWCRAAARAAPPRLLLPPCRQGQAATQSDVRQDLLPLRLRPARRLRPTPLHRRRRPQLLHHRRPPRPRPPPPSQRPRDDPPPRPRHRPGLPPLYVLPDDRWRRDRQVFGVAVLSRAHPSRISFEAVLFTVDGDRPRAWVASVRDGDCTWRAMPRSQEVKVEFDPYWFESRCVHAAGNIYWHICNSSRALKLDPLTLDFSFIHGPAELGDSKYRIGEMPDDGRLCLTTIVEDEELQIWVCGEANWSDRGWLLERRMCMRKMLDTVPRLPRDPMMRMLCIWISDLDYARTGRVFIKTWGFGRYSFHLETGKLERLEMEDGKEHGHPIWAYTLAWPPAFLAPED